MTHELEELARLELEQPDPLDLGDADEDAAWMRAEVQRTSGDCLNAGKHFYEVWKEHNDPDAGWRYAYCLRKSGFAEAALRAVNRVLAAHPENRGACGEKLWCLYAARLQPAQKENQATRIMEAASEMIKSGASGLPLRMAVFAAVKAAKGKGHWKQVADWCDRVDPLELDKEGRKYKGKTTLSDRERWYYAKLKALVKLEQWEEGQKLAEKCLAQYPRNEDFRRWLARCRLEQGDVQGAREELEFLTRSGRSRWYTIADLASLYLEHGDPEAAWKKCLEAARAHGDDQVKVGLWATMARLLHQRGQLEDAANHLGWCLALRKKEGWKTPPELQELRDELCGHAPFDELDCQEWRRRSQRAWDGSGAPAPAPRGERRKGQVTQIQPGRAYAFIKCAGGPIYVQLKDLPQEARQDGARVEFSTVTNFDARKGKDSERAVEVKALP